MAGHLPAPNPGPIACERAPDGTDVSILAVTPPASVARFTLQAGLTGRAVKHRTVDEIWHVLSGEGELWRRLDGVEDIVPLVHGTTVHLPVETVFQVRATSLTALVVLGVITPAWPGDAEARWVCGQWGPSVRDSSLSGPLALRPGRREDADALGELAIRSKAWWGYAEGFLRECRSELSVLPEHVELATVAEIEGELAGFSLVVPEARFGAELEALFVDPRAMGRGAGHQLMMSAMRHARLLGATQLLIQSDPQARGFYEDCGARLIGTRASGSIKGRHLPLLVVDTSIGA